MLVSLALAGDVGLVRADETGTATAAAQSSSAIHPNVNCTCRFSGQNYHIGDTACIRGNIATCATYLNNTSWTMSSSPCPVANYSPAVRRNRS